MSSRGGALKGMLLLHQVGRGNEKLWAEDQGIFELFPLKRRRLSLKRRPLEIISRGLN